MTNVPLPRIDEECTSAFSGSITNEEMLDCISGDNSVHQNLQFIQDLMLTTIPIKHHHLDQITKC